MPYIAINATNSYDEANKTRYATQEEADTRAREILSQFPGARVYTAQVLKEYTARVSITAKEPAEPVPADETNIAV
ncbi:hypothetical protein Q6A49_12365 [Pseudomonas sp. 22-AL-CL-001]|uniref:hypothetical protein n=1 Tax=Pseudomonas alabamensis TaxID=3064349 RepID=UPI002713B7A5|nr:hypothetical protein [Pseudomonas sp. 22-AL-CL-001]MDO7911326.1 hypothetical protein [Pseudomonas sp. 22-AL-CL-001]